MGLFDTCFKRNRNIEEENTRIEAVNVINARIGDLNRFIEEQNKAMDDKAKRLKTFYKNNYRNINSGTFNLDTAIKGEFDELFMFQYATCSKKVKTAKKMIETLNYFKGNYSEIVLGVENKERVPRFLESIFRNKGEIERGQGFEVIGHNIKGNMREERWNKFVECFKGGEANVILTKEETTECPRYVCTQLVARYGNNIKMAGNEITQQEVQQGREK